MFKLIKKFIERRKEKELIKIEEHAHKVNNRYNRFYEYYVNDIDRMVLRPCAINRFNKCSVNCIHFIFQLHLE